MLMKDKELSKLWALKVFLQKKWYRAAGYLLVKENIELLGILLVIVLIFPRYLDDIDALYLKGPGATGGCL